MYTLHKKYVYEGKYVIEDRDVFNSIISSMIVVGAMAGSILGGIIAEKGRRKAVIILSMAFICDCFLLWVFDFFWLLIGRLILGIIIGSFWVVSPLYIREISPKSIAGPIWILNQVMVVLGSITSFIFGIFVPLKDDIDAETSDVWRFIFAFPSCVAFLQICLLLFIFKYDSPIFYLINKDKNNYDKVIQKIYRTHTIDNESIIPHDKCNKDIKDIAWSEILSTKYRYALIVGLTLSVAQQATGWSFVAFYSNEIFMQGLSGNDAEHAARIGTFFLGISSLFAVISAIYMLKIYGRKFLMLYGIIWIGVIHTVLCYASLNNYTGLIKVAVLNPI